MQSAATVDVQRPLLSTHADRERIDADEVRAHHPIVEVVVRYVPRRRTGGPWRAWSATSRSSSPSLGWACSALLPWSTRQSNNAKE